MQVRDLFGNAHALVVHVLSCHVSLDAKKTHCFNA